MDQSSKISDSWLASKALSSAAVRAACSTARRRAFSSATFLSVKSRVTFEKPLIAPIGKPLPDDVLLAEASQKLQVFGFQALRTRPRGKNFFDFRPHPEQIHAGGSAAARVGARLKPGNDRVGQLRADFHVLSPQVFGQPRRGFLPAERPQLDQLGFLLEQLNEAPPAVGFGSKKHHGGEARWALQVSFERAVVGLRGVAEVFRVGKDKQAAPAEHGHLARAVELALEAPGLKFQLRQAPRPVFKGDRADQRRPALFLEKGICAAQEIRRPQFGLRNFPDEFSRAHRGHMYTAPKPRSTIDSAGMAP